MAVFKVYFPTNDEKEEEIEELYGQVLSETGRTCKQVVLLVVGDQNATTGNSKEITIVRLCGLGNKNEAGVWLITFFCSNDIFTTSKFFKVTP